MRRRERPRKRKVSLFKRRSTQVALIVISVIIVGILLYSISHSPPAKFPFKAAIVDQLSISPQNINQNFNQTIQEILKEGGFSVDYISANLVNVDFYRALPSLGYGLIVLRVHAAPLTMLKMRSIAFFTTELYSGEHWPEQLVNRVVRVRVSNTSSEYFGVSSEFFRYSANGRFQNTTIIMMGCVGLNPLLDDMAHALIERGARVYVGWNGSVTMAHTDNATTRLIQYLIAENKTVKEAVDETMMEVGPDVDPQFPNITSWLKYYPEDAGGYAVPYIESSLTLIGTAVNVQDFSCSIGERRRLTLKRWGVGSASKVLNIE